MKLNTQLSNANVKNQYLYEGRIKLEVLPIPKEELTNLFYYFNKIDNLEKNPKAGWLMEHLQEAYTQLVTWNI